MQDSSRPRNEPEQSQAEFVASPCVGVCRLDTQQVCIGCGRHIVEITAAGVAARRGETGASGKLKKLET